MIRRLALLFLLMAPLCALAQTPAPETGEKPCREHPRLIGKCFTVRGRLAVYNGAPALRLWRVGTRRVLGISEQRFSVAGYRNVPKEIEEQINQDVNIVGDFLVCPFTRLRPGEMQLVCIDRVENLVVRERQRGANYEAVKDRNAWRLCSPNSSRMVR